MQTGNGGAAAPGKSFTRLVCPYPQVAKYKGQGDEADAASWQWATD
jgi:hypothetical protein